MMTKEVCCPQCGSKSLWKDGLRYLAGGTVQRWLCKGCGYRFSDSKSKEDCDCPAVRDVQKIPTSSLKTSDSLPYGCQVGARIQSEAKNLVELESRIRKRAAGATTKTEEEVKGKIVEFLWYLKKQGYAKTTIQTRMNLVKSLVSFGADILDPESVKKVLAEQPWKSNSKFQAVIAYDNFAEMAGIRWNPPNYRRVKSIPFVPTETEINQLIAGVGAKLATFLQLVKETGVRFSEAVYLEWTDVNLESQTVNITPKKGSNPRMLRISSELINMLNRLPKKSNRIFGEISPTTLRTNLWNSRKRVAHKLSNPRIGKITFHSLRHWKATMEYHQTKDILHVKKILGHRSIQNTMQYIDIEHALFNSGSNDQFTVKVAETVEEVCELVEAGFEHVTDIDQKKIFRKRK